MYASPTTVDEIEGIADDSGWYAVEELLTVVHREPASVAEGVRPAVDADVPGIVELLSDELVGNRERLGQIAEEVALYRQSLVRAHGIALGNRG